MLDLLLDLDALVTHGRFRICANNQQPLTAAEMTGKKRDCSKITREFCLERLKANLRLPARARDFVETPSMAEGSNPFAPTIFSMICSRLSAAKSREPKRQQWSQAQLRR
jgi:hypothetical protein